jgi:hypothetical protein
VRCKSASHSQSGPAIGLFVQRGALFSIWVQAASALASGVLDNCPLPVLLGFLR